MTSGVPLLAASFASKFDTIGPYVGFGSLIAVVAMAILVFAQGRELQRLREWAGTSPERLDALEEQLRGGGIARVPAQPQQPGVARPGTLARHPAAVGAPGAPHAPGAPVTAAAGGLGAPPAPPAPGAPVTGASTTGDGAPVPPVGPRPVPPRPGAPGTSQATRVVSAASAAGGPRAATAAGQAASTARERSGSGSGGDGPRRPLGQILGLGAVALVVIVALLFALGVIGGDGGDPKVAKDNETDPQATQTTPKKKARSYSLTATRVTVLNGSGTSRVAKTVSDQIDERLRFPMGTPGNYQVDGAQPTQATTTVQYATGSGQSGNRDAAQDIAKALGLRTSAVRAMTSSAKANAPDAKVIVVVGQDLAAKYGNEPSSSAADPGTGADGTSGTSGTTGGTAGTTGTGTGATGGGTASTTQSTPASPSAVDGTGGADTADGAGTTSGGGVAP